MEETHENAADLQRTNFETVAEEARGKAIVMINTEKIEAVKIAEDAVLQAVDKVDAKAAEEARFTSEEEEEVAMAKATEEACIKIEKEKVDAATKTVDSRINAEEEEEAHTKTTEVAIIKSNEEAARANTTEESRSKNTEQQDPRAIAVKEAWIKAEEAATANVAEETRFAADTDARATAAEEVRIKAAEMTKAKAAEAVRLEVVNEERANATEAAKIKAEREIAAPNIAEQASDRAAKDARIEGWRARAIAVEESWVNAEEVVMAKFAEESRLVADSDARARAEKETRMKLAEVAKANAAETTKLEAVDEARANATAAVWTEAEEERPLAAEEAQIKSEEKKFTAGTATAANSTATEDAGIKADGEVDTGHAADEVGKRSEGTRIAAPNVEHTRLKNADATAKAVEEARIEAAGAAIVKATEEARLTAKREAHAKAAEELTIKTTEVATAKAVEEARRKAVLEVRARAAEISHKKAAHEAVTHCAAEAQIQSEKTTMDTAEDLAAAIAVEETNLVAEVDASVRATEDANIKVEESATAEMADNATSEAVDEARDKATEAAHAKAEKEVGNHDAEEARIQSEEEEADYSHHSEKEDMVEETATEVYAAENAEKETPILAKNDREARAKAVGEPVAKTIKEAMINAEGGSTEEAKLAAEWEARAGAVSNHVEEMEAAKAAKAARSEAVHATHTKSAEVAEAEEEAATAHAARELRIKSVEEEEKTARARDVEEARLKATAQTSVDVAEDARIKAGEEAATDFVEEATFKAKEEEALAKYLEAEGPKAAETARAKAAEEAEVETEEAAMVTTADDSRLAAGRNARAKCAEEARNKVEESATAKVVKEARTQFVLEARANATEAAFIKAGKEATWAHPAEEARIRLEGEEATTTIAVEEATVKAEEQARTKATKDIRIKAKQEATAVHSAEEANISGVEEKSTAAKNEEGVMRWRDEPVEGRTLHSSPQSSLFVFHNGAWKGVGIGEASLVRRGGLGKVFFQFKRAKTGATVAEHLIHSQDGHCNLKINKKKASCWMWTAKVESEDRARIINFALTLRGRDDAATFKSKFEEGNVFNVQVDVLALESSMYSQRVKLFQFRAGTCVACGFGQATISRQKVTGKARFTFYPESTVVVMAKHYIVDDVEHCNLRPSVGSDTCWTWSTPDGDLAVVFQDHKSASDFELRFNHAKEVSAQGMNFVGESEVYSEGSLLFQFKDGAWQEGVSGVARMLRHSRTHRVRFVFKQIAELSKTMVIANQYMINDDPRYIIKPHASSDYCWTWSAVDYSTEELGDHTFALKFHDFATAMQFQKAFGQAKHANMEAAAHKCAATAPAVSIRSFTISRSDDVDYKKRFVLTSGNTEVRIGRAPENDICVASSGVSSVHAKIYLDKKSTRLRVLDMSTNGSILVLPGGHTKVVEKGANELLPDGGRLILPKNATSAGGTQHLQVWLTVQMDDALTHLNKFSEENIPGQRAKRIGEAKGKRKSITFDVDTGLQRVASAGKADTQSIRSAAVPCVALPCTNLSEAQDTERAQSVVDVPFSASEPSEGDMPQVSVPFKAGVLNPLYSLDATRSSSVVDAGHMLSVLPKAGLEKVGPVPPKTGVSQADSSKKVNEDLHRQQEDVHHAMSSTREPLKAELIETSAQQRLSRRPSRSRSGNRQRRSKSFERGQMRMQHQSSVETRMLRMASVNHANTQSSCSAVVPHVATSRAVSPEAQSTKGTSQTSNSAVVPRIAAAGAVSADDLAVVDVPFKASAPSKADVPEFGVLSTAKTSSSTVEVVGDASPVLTGVVLGKVEPLPPKASVSQGDSSKTSGEEFHCLPSDVQHTTSSAREPLMGEPMKATEQQRSSRSRSRNGQRKLGSSEGGQTSGHHQSSNSPIRSQEREAKIRKKFEELRRCDAKPQTKSWKKKESTSKPGSFYYFDPETGEAQATKPDGYKDPETGETQPAKPDGSKLVEAGETQRVKPDGSKEVEILWKRVESANTPGSFYFRNTQTGKTQVEIPMWYIKNQVLWQRKESSAKPGVFYYYNAITGESESEPPVVDPPWRLRESNTKKGLFYYYNEETHVSVVDPPVGARKAPPKSKVEEVAVKHAPEAIADGWVKKESSTRKGKFYYLNSSTGETRVDRPVWEKRKARSQPGKVYYFNVETSETSWTEKK